MVVVIKSPGARLWNDLVVAQLREETDEHVFGIDAVAKPGLTRLNGACVESALKDRWLYVSGGPLAGKQFILYKPQTRIGRDQSSDIYLFKDLAVQPQHAVIELRAGRAVLVAAAPTLVSGQPVTQRTLQNGDLIQIGRYSFSYQEKQRPA
jgi:hypothetical protein